VPSVWEEPSPPTVIGQMLQGRLVFVSDIGDLNEVVGSMGLKFMPSDGAELAQRMREAVKDPQMRARPDAAALALTENLFRDQRTVE